MTDKKSNAIPAWQQAAAQSDAPQQAFDSTTQDTKPSDDLLDVARDFLKDEAIRNASHADKVEFLKQKGIPTDDIEKLLTEESLETELKTVHDASSVATKDTQAVLAAEPITPSVPPTASPTRTDLPPIITYPEFLVKPQKPPPLITVDRLVNAGYAIAGVAAFTWAANKYIVEPMLESLTEARHDLADQTLEELEKLNTKLEGTVSHVPYIASTAVKKALAEQEHDDVASIDSDPTELFHRDIATQTSPGLSRASSEISLSRHTLDPTVAQAERLSGLSYSLRSLANDIEHRHNTEKYLQKTVEDFQKKLETYESSYSLLKGDYLSSSTNSDAKKTTSTQEALKFKQEIRALKGAFLSSRNFPSAPRPTTAVAGGYSAR